MTEEMELWAQKHQNDIKKIYGKIPVTRLEYKQLMLELIRKGFTEWSTELRRRSDNLFDNYEEFLAEPNPFPNVKWSEWKSYHPHYYQILLGNSPLTKMEYYDLIDQLTQYEFYRQMDILDELLGR